MKLSLQIKILLGFSLVLGLLGLTSFLAYRNTITFAEDAAWEARTHAVQSRLSNVAALLGQMESDQRGYVITGDAQYLTLYQTEERELEATLQELRTLIADRRQQQELERLPPLITKKLDYMASLITLRRTAGLPAALEQVQTHTGKQLMDQIQHTMHEMHNKENDLLHRRKTQAAASARRTRQTIIFSSLFALLIVSGALWLVRREITAREKADHRLRMSEERFRALADSSPIGIFLTDTHGQCLYTNRRWQQICDLTLEESLHEGWRQTIHPEDRAAVLATWHTDAQAGREYAQEFRILTRQGEVRWVQGRAKPILDENGEITGHVGTSADLTDRKQAELALRKSEERYRALFESAADGIVTSTSEGIITDCNTGLETLLGWSREELRGSHFQKLVPRSCFPPIEAYIKERIAGASISTIESELVSKNGGSLPVESLLTCLYDDTHQLTGFQVIHRDISARKALEQQRAEFLAMLTHDIKNPLGVILGYAEMLTDEAQRRKAAEEVHMLQQLRSQALLVHALVANYLDLSRTEAGQLTLQTQPLLLNELLDQVTRRYRGEAQRQKIKLILQVPDESPIIEGDIHALTRIFTNLLHNALKFTPEGGRIVVTVTHCGSEAMVTVTDSGTGIAPDDLALVFDKYHRGTVPHKEGAGLGLFIVKTFVEAHGGRVFVNNAPNGGAQFAVILPMETADTKEALDTITIEELLV